MTQFTELNDPTGYKKRKEERALEQSKKLIACSACSGSGHYDHSGSPKCGSCNGTGKIRER